MREKLRGLLVSHTDMLNARFIDKTLSYTNFIKLSGEIRKEVQEALKQEEMLAQQLDNLLGRSPSKIFRFSGIKTS